MANEIQEMLKSIKLYDTHINNKLEEVAALRDMITKITATLRDDASLGGGNNDKVGAAVAKIVDLENEINEAVDRYVDRKREIDAIVERVTNADQLRVLHKLYYEYKSWGRIAEEMHMTERNAQFIHGRALLTIARILKEGGYVEH